MFKRHILFHTKQTLQNTLQIFFWKHKLQSLNYTKPKWEPGNNEAYFLQLTKSNRVKSWSLGLSESTSCTLWRSSFLILPLPPCYHQLPSDDDCNRQLQLLMKKEKVIQRIQWSQFTPSYTPSKACLGLFCKGLVSVAQWQLFLSSSVFYVTFLFNIALRQV